jgi:hypothetical protein
MNENIIENVEYPKSPVAYQISQMNLDEKVNLSKITDGNNSFSSSYEIILSAPNSYIIR